MIRLRRPAAAIAVLALGPLSGCGAVPSTDTAARVDDAVLTQQQLEQMVASTSSGIADPAASAATLDMAVAREVLTYWVFDEAISDEATARGLEVAPIDRTASNLTELQNHAGQAYQLVAGDETATTPTSDQIDDAYRSMVCLNVLQALTDAQAAAIVDELNAERSFAEVVTDQQIEISVFLGCFPPDLAATLAADGVGDNILAEFGDDFASAAPGEVIGPISTKSGILLFQRAPLDELDPDQTAGMMQQALLPQVIASRDVEIASMYGTFSLLGGVVPLGVELNDQLGG